MHRQTEIVRGFANSTAEAPEQEDFALIGIARARAKAS
jgi:hypothetical protein